MDLSNYQGNEQTWVKHHALKRYLQVLAFKFGHFGGCLNYVDGFSGPWNHCTQDLSDTSPGIALDVLNDARGQLSSDFRVRAYFNEANPTAHRELLSKLPTLRGEVDTYCRNGPFEDAIPDVVNFVHGSGSSRPFTFVFIDPTGWTGFGMDKLEPIFRLEPVEVLVNFMTKDIKRFIDVDEPATVASFVDLFGQDVHEFRARWKGQTGLDREDSIVSAYCDRLKSRGNFAHVGSAVILNPSMDKTHFHLIYGTRSLHGLVAFRDVEWSVFHKQTEVRDWVKQRKEEDRTRQFGLFGATEVSRSTTYNNMLVRRYQDPAEQCIQTLLRTKQDVSYDDLLAEALSYPLTRRALVNEWLTEWAREGRVELVGLGPRERVLKPEKGHRVRWQ
ncbi:MAG: three-Cys-motif partner protein TcmP [Alphaproteobacteria bacterium]|nr:three-Cys-motif partner protein TcmP [Alphaproteobacteria bacterium]